MKRFLGCPECQKRGVTLRLGGDDCYVCRYCQWSCYLTGRDYFDVRRRSDLAAANPGHPEAPLVDAIDRNILFTWETT